MGTTTATQVSDFGQLLDGCERHDAAATARLYRRYQPMLARYSARRGASDAEGTADLAMFDAIRAIPTLQNRTESGFRAYAFRCAGNRVASELRRPRLDTQLLLDADGPQPWVDDPADQVAGSHRVHELLNALTEDQRAVLEERLFQGHSSRETAERLGKTPGAVRKLQHDALRRLRRVMLVAAVALVAGVGLAAIVASGPQGAPVQTVDRGLVPGPNQPVPSVPPAPSRSFEPPSPTRVPTTVPEADQPPPTGAIDGDGGPPPSEERAPDGAEPEEAAVATSVPASVTTSVPVVGPAPVIRSCERDDGLEIRLGDGVDAVSYRYFDGDLNPLPDADGRVRYVAAVAADGATSEPVPCRDD